MQTLEQLQLDLKDLLTDNIQSCIKELKRLLSPKSMAYDDLILVQTRYNELSKKEHQAIIHEENVKIDKNQIITALLAFINRLTNEDLKVEAFQAHSIETIILVVTNDEAMMRKFFSTYFFKNVHFTTSNTIDLPDACELIVFDNKIMGGDLYNEKDEINLSEEVQQHLGLLRTYLSQTSLNIVYYGNNLDLVTKYRDRIHAANSQFALYARIKEMIEFMRYYKLN